MERARRRRALLLAALAWLGIIGAGLIVALAMYGLLCLAATAL